MNYSKTEIRKKCGFNHLSHKTHRQLKQHIMTKIVGLTGGIGSGKTTVAKMFEELGAPIYIADYEAKIITNKPETLQLIEQEFGSAVIQNGQLNRPAMADLVFNNPEKLQQLNAIIHPLVAKHFQEWLITNKKAPFIIKEAAILFETNNHLLCDFVVTVTAPLDVRISRVQKRDNSSRQEIESRINTQWSDKQRIALSNFVIENNNLQITRQQVENIYTKIAKNCFNL